MCYDPRGDYWAVVLGSSSSGRNNCTNCTNSKLLVGLLKCQVGFFPTANSHQVRWLIGYSEHLVMRLSPLTDFTRKLWLIIDGCLGTKWESDDTLHEFALPELPRIQIPWLARNLPSNLKIWHQKIRLLNFFTLKIDNSLPFPRLPILIILF